MSPIGYARVSTREDRQLLDRQLDALRAAGCERIFDDRMTGIQADRPGLIACLDHLRTGDVLVVLDLDRLGRRARDLIGLIEDLEKRGIAFKALNSPMDTTTPAGRAFLQIQAAFAQIGRCPRPRSPWRPATGRDRRATALCPVSDCRPGPEHSTDLLRTGRYARQHALPLSSCRWHAQGTRANADRGRCVNWSKESLPSPLRSKRNLQERCGPWSGADMCAASAAACSMPRAQMGVRGSGPIQAHALEALVAKLVFLIRSLDRAPSLSSDLPTPRQPRGRDGTYTAATGARYTPPLASSAQTIRAILLASATRTSIGGLRASMRPSHEPAGTPLRAAQRATALAPMISKRRSERSPILDVRPSRSLPPLER